MKAARISQYGGPEVVEIQEIDRPEPAAQQVLVKVHGSSLNPFDSKLRRGLMKELIPLQFPVTLGGDIAGVVEAVGTGVDTFQPGDKVYGQANAVAGASGAFAEFATTAPAQLAVAPTSLSLADAASLPLVGCSALQALTDHIQLQTGQKIFIHGGAGGIGSIAIQVAKHLGAYVATTATGDDIEFVENLGADVVVDYKKDDFVEKLNEFDAVFDTVGGDDFARSYNIIKQGGVAVSMAADPDDVAAEAARITAIFQGTKVTSERLTELATLVDRGIVTTRIGQKFSLDEIVAAFAARETGNVNGKIVITIAE